MQLAKPEVPGLGSFMTALRRKIVDAGPYEFIKLTHHTSYNAVNESVLDEWSETTNCHRGNDGEFDSNEQEQR